MGEKYGQRQQWKRNTVLREQMIAEQNNLRKRKGVKLRD